MDLTKQGDNRSNKVSIFGTIMLMYYALIIPSSILYMIGVFFGVLMICISRGFKMSWNHMVFVLLLFSISYFAIENVIGYSPYKKITYGLTIVLMYIFGLNWFNNDDDYNQVSEKTKKAINIIYKCIYLYLMLCAIYTFLKGYSVGILSRGLHVFWNGAEGHATHFASMSAVLLAISIYYILISVGKERIINIIIFTSVMMVNMIMANRVILVFAAILLLCSIIIANRGKKIGKKTSSLIIVLSGFLICYLIYSFNLFGVQNLLINIPLFERASILNAAGYKDPRIERQLYILSNFLKYTNGGGYFSQEIGDSHNVWLDIYDYTGWFPFLCFMVYTIRVLQNTVFAIKNSINDASLSLLTIMIIGFGISFMEEPVFRSCEAYFVLFIFITGILESCRLRKIKELNS